VNQVYTFTNWTNGWRITSGDGQIVKTVTLDDESNWFKVDYSVNPALHGGVLYVRHGFSPDLLGLLIHGQDRLSDEAHESGVMSISQSHPNDVTVAAMLAYAGGPYNTIFNFGAVDDDPGQGVEFFSVNMRNQAQTHQVEVFGTNEFSFALGFEVLASDLFNDGVPHEWLMQYYPDPAAVNVHDLSSNQVNTIREAYIAGLSPVDPGAFFEVESLEAVDANAFLLRWYSVSNRVYHIRRSADLMDGEESFVPIATDVPATPPENIYEDTDVEGAPTYFYRIGVEYPGGLQE